MNKVLNIVKIVLFLLTAVVLGFFVFGGEVPNQLYPTPVYTDLMLNWAYALAAIATACALVFPVVRLFSRPKQAMKSLVVLGLIAVIVGIAYALADPTPLKLIGYTGPDNVPSRLIMTDTVLNTMYILFGLAIASIIVTEIYRKVR